VNEGCSRSNSFVLRIWWEEGDGPPIWRGWVQHAASGDSCYVHQLADLVAFLETRTGSLDVASSGKMGEGATDNSPYDGDSP
jgi:hypothetical protein